MNILTPSPTPQHRDSRAHVADLRIEGGRTLIDGELVDASVTSRDGRIDAIGRDGGARDGASTPTGCWCCPASSTFMAMPSSGR